MNRYEIIIYWSEEDQAFISEVPELPGCAAHGETQEMALANAKEAIGLWIKTAKEFGDYTDIAARPSSAWSCVVSMCFICGGEVVFPQKPSSLTLS